MTRFPSAPSANAPCGRAEMCARGRRAGRIGLPYGAEAENGSVVPTAEMAQRVPAKDSRDLQLIPVAIHSGPLLHADGGLAAPHRAIID